MSCSPHYCNSHNTMSSQCIGNRASCTTNRALNWSITEGDLITASRIETLRNSIRDEVQRWNTHRNYEVTLTAGTGISSGEVINTNIFNDLDLMVGPLYGSFIADEIAGNIVGDDEWKLLIDRYNIVRQNCICNSDCSCNSICSCYGNCGCNY